jgi:hypothetical protein
MGTDVFEQPGRLFFMKPTAGGAARRFCSAAH